ncbi:class I SAM-dependent methyltransferase [Psychromicrobium sp. YIM B11713]|uniref:class I SAM-dependent methyltransferase n=1 Tax=Psychromicrobium sp. YIM B11713 TaxID=3145233 RepID=UPI00374FB05E
MAMTSLWDGASSDFGSWREQLWQPLADLLVAEAQPAPGELVLDACCGNGTSAIPAARAVGPRGRVDAIDVSPAMIRQAEYQSRALPQLSYAVAEISQWRSELRYDLVLCGFGVFFLGDPELAVKQLCSRLRPGGRLAFSCWQNRPFEPLVSTVLAACAEEGVVTKASAEARNIGKLNSAEKLQALAAACSLQDFRVQPVPYRVPLTPDSAWHFVQGSLLRAALPAEPAAQQRIRSRIRASVQGMELHADALIGVGIH